MSSEYPNGAMALGTVVVLFPAQAPEQRAVIARCGQPEVSWWGWRNADDEHLVQSVARACASDSRSSGSKPSARNSPRDSLCRRLSDVEFGKESLGLWQQVL